MRNMDWEDRAFVLFIGAVTLAFAVGACLLVFVFGYLVGLYNPPCVMVSSQPRCVKAGWQGQEKLNVKGEGEPLVKVGVSR